MERERHQYIINYDDDHGHDEDNIIGYNYIVEF